MSEHFDVLVVGAGISGVGAGYHLQANSPDRSYAILESRERMGGTWDLFRYPGIRSDSDMFTLGFSFKPWTEAKAIADGPSILNYLEETAAEYGIDKHIRYRHRVKSAAWSTADARWSVEAECDGEARHFTCDFLFMCTGYYNYARAYSPEFAGAEDFGGRIVHPQFWTGDIDYTGKRVVVIGSGATAVTLVPEMAKQAGHVTMLQRSPTYIVARPSEDRIANWLRRRLPSKTAYVITRWKNVLLQQYFFRIARKRPALAKRRILQLIRNELPDYDIDTHFTPTYNPWDQRVCLIPDADLFASIREGKASVVTDTIDHLDRTGLVLTSGARLDADLVVTATGLELQLMSGIPFSVDGVPVDWARHTTYKGMMMSDVPNMAISFGYTNASWTLKADLTSTYVTRLLNAMRKRGMRQVTPRIGGPVEPMPFLDFTSGYVQRAMALFPRQGTRTPWRLNQSYSRDLMALKYGSLDTEMEFSNPVPEAKAA
jgi:cation diffusion facilitator CzcD-associated flavoprotein CzcO